MKKLNEKYDYYTTPYLEYVRIVTGQESKADQYDKVKQTTGLPLIQLLDEIYTLTLEFESTI